ncbi:unnamed protein product, partial [marine sediment metagenome]
CGFGSALLEAAAAKIADGGQLITDGKRLSDIRLLGMPKRFIRHNSRDAQLIKLGINADTIEQTARAMLSSAK